MSLPANLKLSLRRNARLSQYCTMQVGGEARLFAEPTCEEELLDALEVARQENLPFVILGKGSNVIFPDDGFHGLVISFLHFQESRVEIDSDTFRVTASSGVHLYRLATVCRDAGLGGAEFLASIPGTVGGAVVMNAGFSRFPGQRSEIGDLVQSVTVVNSEGQKKKLSRNELSFSYRKTNLDEWVVLEVELLLWRRKSEDIATEIRANFDYRNQEQDLKHPSSGSIFKNPEPPSPSAGRLIDKAGLKGLRIGGAMVSEKHGNYFINVDHAKSSDLIALIQKVRLSVFDATQIDLETEVRIIQNP